MGRARSEAEIEAEACAGVSPQERDVGPLVDRTAIERVSELRERSVSGKVVSHLVRGAEIVVRPQPGMTRVWLARVSRCHAVRHATTILPDRGTDPLAVTRAEVTVREGETAFVIAIRADDDEAAAEIVRRARALLPARPSGDEAR